MQKIITHLANELHISMRKPGACGVLYLPQGYDITFDFTNKCNIELRKETNGLQGCYEVINNSSFKLIEEGKWISVDVFTKEIEELLKNITFTLEDIDGYNDK